MFSSPAKKLAKAHKVRQGEVAAAGRDHAALVAERRAGAGKRGGMKDETGVLRAPDSLIHKEAGVDLDDIEVDADGSDVDSDVDTLAQKMKETIFAHGPPKAPDAPKSSDPDAAAAAADVPSVDDAPASGSAPQRTFIAFQGPSAVMQVERHTPGKEVALLPGDVKLTPAAYSFDLPIDETSEEEVKKLDGMLTDVNGPAGLPEIEKTITDEAGNVTKVVVRRLPDSLYQINSEFTGSKLKEFIRDTRFHAPWPYPDQLVMARESMEGLKSETVRADFPLDAGAQKKHFYEWQRDPTRNYGDERAFALPLKTLGPAIVVSARIKTVEGIETLGPRMKCEAILSSKARDGFQGDRANAADAKDGESIYEMDPDHAALFDDPEFRRWAGVNAEEEKAKLRQGLEFSGLQVYNKLVKDERQRAAMYSAPVSEVTIDASRTLDSDGKVVEDPDQAGLIHVPLLDKPQTLAEMLVLSYASELTAASANMRRNGPDSKRLFLALNRQFKAIDPSSFDDDSFHGHVTVSLDALDAVIDYYCNTYHPAQFASQAHLLKLIPKGNGMMDLHAMASAENKAGGCAPFAYLGAELEVVYMPYHGPIYPRPGNVETLEQLTELITDALETGTDQELADEMVKEGLDVGEDDNPCFGVMARNFAARKAEEAEYVLWHETPYTGPRIEDAGAELRADSDAVMAQHSFPDLESRRERRIGADAKTKEGYSLDWGNVPHASQK